MSKEVLVLGAGIVGLSTAIHLRRRGVSVVLVDKQGPGSGASFGNGGLIQREAVFPYRFPREVGVLLRMARNRSVDVSYHPCALLRLAPRLLKYWWNSSPARYSEIVIKEAALIASCLDEHLDLAREAGAEHLLRPTGWRRSFSSGQDLEAAATIAKTARDEFGVNFSVLDGAGLANAEPHLAVKRAGAIHWTDSLSLSDPGALLNAHADLLLSLGGHILRGDAESLTRHGEGWRVDTDIGPVDASEVVIALGAASSRTTRRFGYKPPLFGKRGYHMHYRMRQGTVLNAPLLDTESGFLLNPMSRGVRLTTGVEFAGENDPATPIQLERSEPLARRLLPLDERLDPQPWLGVRPCMPDMLPVIGPAPGIAGLWCGFGHGHQGLTLGPSTGRLLAELITGEPPFIDPEGYRADRF
jgi:D-amino-acid dehydrogenase